MNEPYTNEQEVILIDMYFRDNTRPTPMPAIAEAMGRPGQVDGLDELLWKIITGYTGNDPTGPRRPVLKRPQGETHREGLPWYPREHKALRKALQGKGQLRNPPVTVRYIAIVLARTPQEVQAEYDKILDPLQREGFGLGGK